MINLVLVSDLSAMLEAETITGLSQGSLLVNKSALGICLKSTLPKSKEADSLIAFIDDD